MIKLKVILTGATGMVGEGVLHETLLSDKVESVLILVRKSSGIKHPKLTEVVLENFFDLSSIISKLSGYNTFFFCAGVSAIGKKEEEYARLTYDLTMYMATAVLKLNPEMTFNYISGSGTDSTEKGSMMWARVKGKTENDLLKLPFKKVYLFRPGYMHPTPGLKNTLPYYKYLSWLYPIVKIITPGFVSTLADLGHAMINATYFGYSKNVIEVKDIHQLKGL
jgi:uncharacterized protein YbjT (DUF2867 family)